MRLKFKIIILGLLIAVFSNKAQALVEQPVYTTEVAVADRGNENKKAATEQGFSKVIANLIGQELDSEEYPLPTNIDKYLSNFAYKDKSAILNLQLTFNERMVSKWLESQKLAYLGKLRPTILILLRVRQQDQVDFLNTDKFPQEVAKVESLSLNTNIPVVLPLLDIVEHSMLESAFTDEGSSSVLKQFASRYAADQVLLGDIFVSDGEFRGAWKLSQGEKFHCFETQSVNLLEHIPLMYQEVFASLLQHNGNMLTNATTKNGIVINVGGVDSMEKYAKVASYLKSLPEVSRVDVSGINTDHANFVLHTKNDKQVIARAIQLDNILQEEVNMQTAELGYRLD